MIEQLKNIWQRRELLYYIVRFQMKAEIKSKVLTSEEWKKGLWAEFFPYEPENPPCGSLGIILAFPVVPRT